jgi:hypothetical protein
MFGARHKSVNVNLKLPKDRLTKGGGGFPDVHRPKGSQYD